MLYKQLFFFVVIFIVYSMCYWHRVFEVLFHNIRTRFIFFMVRSFSLFPASNIFLSLSRIPFSNFLFRFCSFHVTEVLVSLSFLFSFFPSFSPLFFPLVGISSPPAVLVKNLHVPLLSWQEPMLFPAHVSVTASFLSITWNSHVRNQTSFRRRDTSRNSTLANG